MDPYVPGVTPYNWEQQSMRASSIAVTVLATVLVFLRLWVRIIQRQSIFLHDYIIILALVFTYFSMVSSLVAIHYGMKIHASRVSPHDTIIILKVMIAWECVYAVGIVLVKLSILVLYSSIFLTTGFLIAAWSLALVTTGWGIAIFFVCLFQCTPMHKAWNRAVPGHCINIKDFFYGNAVPNIITDASILILPMIPIYKLQIPMAQRISVMMIFLLGVFVLAASIYRFTTLLQIDFDNASYTLAPPSLWSLIEVAVAVICACLPTLRPLLRIYLGLGSYITSGNNTNATTSQSRLGRSIRSRNRRRSTAEESDGQQRLDRFYRLPEHEGDTASAKMVPFVINRTPPLDAVPLNEMESDTMKDGDGSYV